MIQAFRIIICTDVVKRKLTFVSLKGLKMQRLKAVRFLFLFQVLDLLWSLSHLPSLTTEMVDQALKSHIEILSDSYSVKEQIKKNYAIKCVEDMKKGVLIVPAIRQLLKITRGMVKQQFNKNDKVVLSV